MRQEQVEHSAIALTEIRVGAIELEPCVGAPRLEVELQHVLDPQRAVDVLVERSAPELVQRNEVGQPPCSVSGAQRILVGEPAMGGADFRAHLAAWLTGEDENAFGTLRPFVERDDVARHELAKRA
jgi:hypothetical protein